MFEWLKVIHLLAVISWMAGLLYLPRLMVYHVGAEIGSAQDLTFRTLERRLLKAIMRPAALVVLVSGVGLIHSSGAGLLEMWLLVKLAAVAGLFAVHGVLESYAKKFQLGVRNRGSTFFRVLNEGPTVLMVVVVIMVVVKPF
jgi:protoporphyrinogen IX oxidase